MEYAKDEIYNIIYNDGTKIIRKDRTSGIMSAIRQNKFIGFIIGMTFILCIANFLFIYNFFSILSKI